MNFSVLCYDKKDNLVLATTSQDVKANDYVEVFGKGYTVIEAGDMMVTMGYSSKVIYLEKYKASRRKVS